MAEAAPSWKMDASVLTLDGTCTTCVSTTGAKRSRMVSIFGQLRSRRHRVTTLRHGAAENPRNKLEAEIAEALARGPSKIPSTSSTKEPPKKKGLLGRLFGR